MPKKSKEKKEKNPVKANKEKLVILDAHAILHRAYHALPDFVSSKGEPTGALFGLVTMIFSLIKELKPDYIVAAFDLPKPTYRHEAYADYKAGRRETDNDLKKQFNRAKDLLKIFNIPIYEQEGFEADDILGTIVEQTKNQKELQIFIASGDMDTLQLVSGKKVQVYTLKKGIKDTVIYDEGKVVERFGFKPKLVIDYKGLRGDPSDNIIGVAGIGEKTATNLILHFGTIENIYKKLAKIKIEDEKMSGPVFDEFKEAGVKERIIKLLIDNQEEALFSKMLATIRLDAPVDFKLPKQKWYNAMQPDPIKVFFRELDFRTLISRFDNLLADFGVNSKIDGADVFSKDSNIENKNTADIQNGDQDGSNNVQIKSNVDEQDFKEVSLALWILDSNVTNPTLEDIFAYTSQNESRDFQKSKEIIFDELKKKKLEFIFEKIEKPLMSVIERMEKNGVLINLEELKKLSDEYHGELEEIQKQIYTMADQEFNLNSTKQLSEVLFEKMNLRYKGMRKTSTGKYSTKEEILVKLKDEGNKIAELILEYRELQKLLSTYIDNFPEFCGKDGRIHANFSQTGTTTGRLSSNDPNLQNIPVGSVRGRKIRKAFICEKGNTLISFDYSQVELRIAAFLSGDEKLISAFKNNLDIHTAVASEVFDVSPEEVTKEQRRKAKVINFGILYGMGVSALQKNLGTDRKTAQSFYNKYFEKYSGVADYVDRIKKEAAMNKYTTTLFGRRRYFEGFNSPLPFIRAQAERMAINAPIQGTQADLIKLAMVEIDNYLQKQKIGDQVKLILQIHDEVIYEIPAGVLKDSEINLEKEIKKIMENILNPEQTKGVPILVESNIGESWGDLK